MIRYTKNDIEIIKNRSKNGCSCVFTPETMIGVLDYFEREVTDLIKLSEMRMKQDDEEKRLLLQQIERTLDEQPDGRPALPLEVAEAIITCAAAGIPNYRIIGFCEVTGRLFRDFDRATINALDTIKMYKNTSDECEEKLFRALVLGYTVEQTLQQRINEGVSALARVWIHEVKVVNEESTIEFASKVARFVQEVHAE